ncbi:ArsR/SmtB family transcription factor [Pengzhenrongella sicca]|uniref:Helix-turn-helix transcriptional regulator n=1 Tax=Pengzhenrongella sicca TaxID=2819238 RepID=A0A8A4ZEX4_9MICO|nr:helix-turn-helix domain-containing protein [Pengzhenrongella sicca]QTE28248.1 helix-turn-helix transcriptional regulator [Pengzhenrongella sicca]
MSPTNEPELTGLHLDAAALKVLAHPLRSRLLSALRRGGPATATDLARQLGTNTGATSYHLRKLETVGLVADTGEGEGKRRLWRAATDSHGWTVSDFAGDEDSETALNWLVRDYSRLLGREFERWLDVEGSWPLPWRDAAGMSDYAMLVTAEQAEALKAELDELVTRYRLAGQGNPEARRLALWSVLIPTDLDEGGAGEAGEDGGERGERGEP